MKSDSHLQARQLIACSGADGLDEREQMWLNAHLRDCGECREYADAIRGVVRGLRAVPVAAEHSLVNRTKLRLRQRAQELEEQRRRLNLMWMSLAIVAVASGVTATVLWQTFAWVSEWMGWPSVISMLAFALFWIAPSVTLSLAFVAKGTHLGSRTSAE